jgi:hypothetical protein
VDEALLERAKDNVDGNQSGDDREGHGRKLALVVDRQKGAAHQIVGPSSSSATNTRTGTRPG